MGQRRDSYALYQDAISRNVPLGTFTDQNSADTAGDSLGLALRLGGDLKWGAAHHRTGGGLGAASGDHQGFAESGGSGITALSFGRAKRDSTVSQVGWHVMADVGRFRPFAEAQWNHEFVDSDRKVTADLTTIAAPAYSMDAVPVPIDWGTVSLGTSFKASERVMLRASFTTMFGTRQTSTTAGNWA